MDDGGINYFGICYAISYCAALNHWVIKIEHRIAALTCLFHYCTHATCFMDVLHMHSLQRWRDFGYVGYMFANLIKLCQIKIYTSFIGNRHHMKDRIGAATHCHIYHKGVVHRFFVEDISDFILLGKLLIFGNFTYSSCSLS